MARVVSVRIPDAVMVEVESRLRKYRESGARIALKTKGKSREYRVSDVVIDMLGDAIIKGD